MSRVRIMEQTLSCQPLMPFREVPLSLSEREVISTTRHKARNQTKIEMP